MKIRIEIDVDPDEIPLATELITLIRSLTSSHAPAFAPVARVCTSGPGVIGTVTTLAQPSPSPRVPSPAATTQQAGVGLTSLFRMLMARLGHAATEEEETTVAAGVATEVLRAIDAAAPQQDEALEIFFGTFCDIAFNPARLKHNFPIIPYVAVLPRLAEPVKSKIRDKLIQKVLKFLTIKRPVDCSRMEFFTYAEAFAALIKVEFVNITGAVTTITTLLQKQENRCAAVTMLGKTVELCLALIKDKCERPRLSELRAALHTCVTEPEFVYDVNYIDQNMGWDATSVLSPTPTLQTAQQPTTALPTPVPTPAHKSEHASEPAPVSCTSPRRTSFVGAPATSSTLASSSAGPVSGMPAPAGRLAKTARFQGHGATIFALAYDSMRDSLLSNSKDGQIIVWDPEGNKRDTLSMSGQYACSMDINPRTRCLYISGVPGGGPQQQKAGEPTLFMYRLAEQSSKWQQTGTFKSTRLVSCVEAMVQDQGNHLAAGESSKSERLSYVNFYDIEKAPSFDLGTPVVSYQEHEDYVTSLAHHPSSEGLLFSGSRDSTVRLWDFRQRKSAAILGSGTPTRRSAHEFMVTCVDSVGCLVASGALDRRVCVWDLRNLNTPSFSIMVEEAVLKIALSPQSNASCPVIAASTNKAGMFLVMPSQQGPQALVPTRDVPRELGIYDLVWGERDDSGNPFLYAGGDDLYKLSVHWEH
eukprot:m51a1_g5406 Coatomer subunit beta' B (700) ;mRNA; r:74002-76666